MLLVSPFGERARLETTFPLIYFTTRKIRTRFNTSFLPSLYFPVKWVRFYVTPPATYIFLRNRSKFNITLASLSFFRGKM